MLKKCRENQDASPKQKFASLNCFLTNHLSKVEIPIQNDNLTFLIQKTCIRQMRNYKKRINYLVLFKRIAKSNLIVNSQSFILKLLPKELTVISIDCENFWVSIVPLEVQVE